MAALRRRRAPSRPCARRSRALEGLSTIDCGAPSSVITPVSWSVRQNVANAERSHFVLSTMAMTSRADAVIARLICASSSVASERPVSTVNPAAPRNAFCTLILPNTPSPMWPTSESASQRTKPPGIATVIPGVPASSEAIRSPLVRMVRCVHGPPARICRATASAVVLASNAMLSPSVIMPAPRRPMTSFLAGCRSSRTWNVPSVRPSDRSPPRAIAPPCALISRPSCSRRTRSLRMVTRETPKMVASSLTCARPCSATNVAMRS